MNKSLLQNLIQKYLTETLSAKELDQLRSLMEEKDSEFVLDEEFKSLFTEQMQHEYLLPETDQRIQQYVINHLQDGPAVSGQDGLNRAARSVRRVHFLPKWGWAAASAIFLVGISAYLWTANKKNPEPAVTMVNSGDVVPGKTGAILTLADGSQVVLDSLDNGLVAAQKGTKVLLQNGQLAYDPTGKTGKLAAFNTLTTPKGRQFQVVLPDRTKVWLNAASSIRYPTVFTGAMRKVEVTGEAYFEVAKNAEQPFQVRAGKLAEIVVLGTNFNVNAYENEATVNTTLLKGSVRVNGTIIKEGQQAQVLVAEQVQSEVRVVKDADLDKVMAWKNGSFNFEDASLEEIMRQLERWYDIEVVYAQHVPDVALTGEMTRDVSLNGLLSALRKMGVNGRLEGRRLIILP